MKNKIALIGGLLITAVILSFTTIERAESEDKIVVTAEQPVQFDMFRNSLVSTNLTTPQEFTFTHMDSRFIFKSFQTKEKLVVTVYHDGKRTIVADWPLVVLLIDGETFTCFGMD